ncbi:hypothetical protein N0V82_007396 [Gnomoniopsis sp. IMI 355080]|nr:hypothetical protein N0V82_007396 [Gnomoniopsis sp. IMI 355080]
MQTATAKERDDYKDEYNKVVSRNSETRALHKAEFASFHIQMNKLRQQLNKHQGEVEVAREHFRKIKKPKDDEAAKALKDKAEAEQSAQDYWDEVDDMHLRLAEVSKILEKLARQNRDGLDENIKAYMRDKWY